MVTKNPLQKELRDIKKRIMEYEDEHFNLYNENGYLPQNVTAYTAISTVRQDDGLWVMRQTDIIDGKIVKVIDSKPNARAVVFEYFKIAAADHYYKENY